MLSVGNKVSKTRVFLNNMSNTQIKNLKQKCKIRGVNMNS